MRRVRYILVLMMGIGIRTMDIIFEEFPLTLELIV